jgi:hypothetical protein
MTKRSLQNSVLSGVKHLPVIISLFALIISALGYRQSVIALNEVIKDNNSKRKSILIAEQVGPTKYNLRLSRSEHVIQRLVVGLPSEITDVKLHVQGSTINFSEFDSSVRKVIESLTERVKPGYTKLSKIPMAVFVGYTTGDVIREEIQLLQLNFCHWWEEGNLMVEYYDMEYVDTLPANADPTDLLAKMLKSEPAWITVRTVGAGGVAKKAVSAPIGRRAPDESADHD